MGLNLHHRLQNSASKVGSHPLSTSGHVSPFSASTLKQSRHEGASSGACYASSSNHVIKTVHHSNGSVIYPKNSYKTARDGIRHEEFLSTAKYFFSPHKGKAEFASSPEVVSQSAESSPGNKVSTAENNSCIKHPTDDPKSSYSSGSLESESIVSGPSEADAGQLNNHMVSQSAVSFCPRLLTASILPLSYAEAKQSFTNTEVSEEASIVEKSVESGEVLCCKKVLLALEYSATCLGFIYRDLKPENVFGEGRIGI
ncbi:hypothetical protein NC653_004795 [Populus alba x Populus x berolinensis]|uniref:Protein kinase domain-containing protein n=1 Tax=Populus alba x Populus x berolinensis TaxID=444605 RepID=A0AAD6RVA2_9ROSI|nr:hypothetical protein NC653_004795 [Populus alba x Populus x berolinensis]